MLNWQVVVYMLLGFALVLGAIRFFFAERIRSYRKILGGASENESIEKGESKNELEG